MLFLFSYGRQGIKRNLVGAEGALLLHHLLLFLLKLLVDLGALAGLVAVVLGLENLLVGYYTKD